MMACPITAGSNCEGKGKGPVTRAPKKNVCGRGKKKGRNDRPEQPGGGEGEDGCGWMY